MAQIRTIHYAMPPDDYFWRWSDTFDALEFNSGTTCALWDEIQPILSYLAEETGLPPLGSIVLLVTACREDFWICFDTLHDWIKQSPGNHGKAINQLAAHLKVVNSLPADLRRSPEAKCAVINMIFENSPQKLSFEESKETVDELTSGPDCLKWSQPDLTGILRFERDIKGIISGLEGVSTDFLENRLRTGVSSIDLKKPEIQLEKKVVAEPGSLLDALKQSGEEGTMLAGIAERAIAMVHFPGRLDRPDELPVGGIADITNRGTIDRLLPGELAWDDMTLAVRLINGEALYYRREVPPQDSPKRNAIFIDRGLRLWGLNRLFSLGIALGITQQPQWKEEDLSIFTSDHFDSWCPAGLAKLESIEKLLSELIPSPGPATALSQWWSTQSDEINGDVVLISIREHITDPATVRILSEIACDAGARNSHLYVITVDREGSIEIDCRSAGGIRPGIRAKIELSELFEPVEKPAKPPSMDLVKELPEPASSYPFYCLDLPPVLFPVNPHIHEPVVELPNGIASCVDDRIFRWSHPGKGGREICSNLPGSRRWLCGSDGDIILVVSGKPGDPILVYRVFPGELKPFPIDRSRHSFAREVQIDGGALILGYEDFAEAFSLNSGARVAGLSFAELPQYAVFHFDGEDLQVFKGNPPKTHSEDLWFKAQNWEEMIIPEYIAWRESSLHLLAADGAYTLDFRDLQWAKGSVRRQVKLEASRFNIHSFGGLPGIHFKKARLGKSVEVLYDSRGILHIRSSANPDLEQLSIMLLKGKTSAWCKSVGVFSKCENLLPSNGPGRNPNTLIQLGKHRLEALLSQ